MILLWLRGAISIFLLFSIVYLIRWVRYYQRSEKWVERRDVLFNEVYSLCLGMTQAARPHSDEEWGCSMGMPSRNSLALLDVARAIEKERWEIAQILKAALSNLDLWQMENPPPAPPRWKFWSTPPSPKPKYSTLELEKVEGP